jgi:hypothetical protein
MEIPQQWSWLKPSDVFILLKSSESSAYPFITSYSTVPKAGNIFFIRKSQFKRWKQDGHNYISRKNGVGIREDREKYTFGSETVTCTYVHGSGACPSCKNSYLVTCSNCGLNITSVLFHRRAYWLVSNPEIILVHYLDDSMEKITDNNFQSSGEQIKKIAELLRQIDFESFSGMKIIEFCPEWSDVHGGTKVVICTDPPLLVPNPQNLFCAFGDMLVQVESVMLGVFKCFTPPHSPGYVDFYLVYESRDITQTRKIFEFKDLGQENFISKSLEWWESDRKTIEKDLIENMQIDLQEEFDENQFDECFFLTQFSKITEKPDWDDLLECGRSYLHFFCALGFSSLIRNFSDWIRKPTIKDQNDKSPIDIALIKHNYDCAYELIRISCEDSAGLKFWKKDLLNDRVQKIQSHVRAWIQQRQFKNLKSAAKVLQKTFRGMIARRNFKYQKQAAILIQKSVRRWLISLDHH